MATARYTDKRMSEDFTCYALFSEPLIATLSELIEAAAEDYPGLDWSYHTLGSDAIDTRGVTLGLATGLRNQKIGGMKVFGAPGPCRIDWTDALFKNRIVFPEAERAVSKHTDHLTISVSSAKGDGSVKSLVARRFDAARRMTCLAAVLAKLPITTAIYFPNGDTLLPPAAWTMAADLAMKGEVPVPVWMALVVNAFDEPPEPLPITLTTIGMAAFNGQEIVMPRMRLPWPDAMKFAEVMVRMLLEGDHVFKDSDTVGFEAGDKTFRIRQAHEGKPIRFPDGLHEPQTNQLWLFHKTCDLDDVAIFGPRTNRPPPPGFDNTIAGDLESLRKSLYAFHAGD